MDGNICDFCKSAGVEVHDFDDYDDDGKRITVEICDECQAGFDEDVTWPPDGDDVRFPF